MQALQLSRHFTYPVWQCSACGQRGPDNRGCTVIRKHVRIFVKPLTLQPIQYKLCYSNATTCRTLSKVINQTRHQKLWQQTQVSSKVKTASCKLLKVMLYHLQSMAHVQCYQERGEKVLFRMQNAQTCMITLQTWNSVSPGPSTHLT